MYCNRFYGCVIPLDLEEIREAHKMDIFIYLYTRAFYLWNYDFVIYCFSFSFFDLFFYGIVLWGVCSVVGSAIDTRRS